MSCTESHIIEEFCGKNVVKITAINKIESLKQNWIKHAICVSIYNCGCTTYHHKCLCMLKIIIWTDIVCRENVWIRRIYALFIHKRIWSDSFWHYQKKNFGLCWFTNDTHWKLCIYMPWICIACHTTAVNRFIYYIICKWNKLKIYTVLCIYWCIQFVVMCGYKFAILVCV